MPRALIVIRRDADRAKAAQLLAKVSPGTRVEFRKSQRSLGQNALMWARLTDVARQVEWYGQRLSAEDWKDVFSASLRKARVVPGLDAGTYVPLGMRTSDMTQEEMSDLLELMSAFAAERGVVFSDHGGSDAA